MRSGVAEQADQPRCRQGDAAGLLQRQGERQHADDQHQALPVNRLVGAVHVDAAEQAHDQAANQRRQHVGHQAADHQCHHHRQPEQRERCLVGRGRHIVHLGRQAQHEEVAAHALQTVNVLPAAGHQQRIGWLELFIHQQPLQGLAIAAQTDHVELVPAAKTQLLDCLAR